VTVISSSGAIKINSLTPSIGLLCLGRSAIMVPQSQTSTEFPLPPFIDAPFAGIAPAS
jgi:hypothetical protein